MSKELEALERYGYHCNHYVNGEKDYKIIETALKVLEIIESKKIISIFKDINNKYFIVFNNIAIEIPQEEYELLRRYCYE